MPRKSTSMSRVRGRSGGAVVAQGRTAAAIPCSARYSRFVLRGDHQQVREPDPGELAQVPRIRVRIGDALVPESDLRDLARSVAGVGLERCSHTGAARSARQVQADGCSPASPQARSATVGTSARSRIRERVCLSVAGTRRSRPCRRCSQARTASRRTDFCARRTASTAGEHDDLSIIDSGPSMRRGGDRRTHGAHRRRTRRFPPRAPALPRPCRRRPTCRPT